MKHIPMLFFGSGIGAVIMAIHLWSPPAIMPLYGSQSLPPGAAQAVPLPLPEYDRAAEVDSTARASSAGLARVQAVVHSTLRAWRNTATGETAAHDRLMQEFLEILSDENTAEIVRSLAPEDLHTPFGSAAVERWLLIAPADAAVWLAVRSDATEHHAFLVARRLQKYPAALLAYCDTLREDAWKQQVLQHASLGKADTNHGEAIALAERLVAGDARTNAFETIAYSWFERDPVAALRWVEMVSDLTLRERLLALGAKAVARVDADLALDWLIRSVNTDGLVQETALSILETPAQP